MRKEYSSVDNKKIMLSEGNTLIIEMLIDSMGVKSCP
jgi:hypothetical protein